MTFLIMKQPHPERGNKKWCIWGCFFGIFKILCSFKLFLSLSCYFCVSRNSTYSPSQWYSVAPATMPLAYCLDIYYSFKQSIDRSIDKWIAWRHLIKPASRTSVHFHPSTYSFRQRQLYQPHPARIHPLLYITALIQYVKSLRHQAFFSPLPSPCPTSMSENKLRPAEHLPLPICARVGCRSEVHGGWEHCRSDASLVVVLEKSLCHRIGDAEVSVITGLSLPLCVMSGYFTQPSRGVYLLGCADDCPEQEWWWSRAAAVTAQPRILSLGVYQKADRATVSSTVWSTSQKNTGPLWCAVRCP